MFARLIFFHFGILLFLVGCHQHRNQGCKKHISFELQESIARLSDIPDVQLGYHVVEIMKDNKQSNNFSVVYCKKNKKVKKDIADLRNIYIADMERLGWNWISEFETSEELTLMFDKPSGTLCSINLRQNLENIFLTVMEKRRDLV